MTSNVRQIAIEHQRRSVPTALQVAWDGVTNAELAWLADNAARPEVGAFARWELEYREAFDVYVGHDYEAATVRHFDVSDRATFERLNAKPEPSPISGKSVVAAVLRARRAGKPLDVMPYMEAAIKRRVDAAAASVT